MKPMQLDFKPSNTLCILLTLVTVGAFCIVMLVALPWLLKLLLGLVMVISAIYTVLYHGLLLLPWSCVALKINTKNQVQLLRKDGRQLEVTVNDNSVVTPYLTIVNSHVKEASLLQRIFVQHLIILPDAVDAEAYRQLRVWLRWGYSRQPH